MFWRAGSKAPRNVEALARYVDKQLEDLSRALDTLQVFPETYSPIWTHSDSSDPVIGNGTLIGHAIRFGGMAFVQIRLVIGSTTTFETAPSPGNWRFSVPWASASTMGSVIGVSSILDSGTTRLSGHVRLNDTSDQLLMIVSGSLLHSTTPIVWATNDSLFASIMYPVRD